MRIGITFILCFLFWNSSAKKLKGFIINEQNDTIYGEVKVHQFNRTTGAWCFNQIDLEWCYLKVAFRSNSDKRFKYFSPNEIVGYEFTYSGQKYIFRSFNVGMKSIVRRERSRFKFLNLVRNSNGISIYRSLYYINNPIEKSFYSMIPRYEYFYHSNSNSNREISISVNSVDY